MKKMLALMILLVGLTAVFSGCGKNGEDGSKSENKNEKISEEGLKIITTTFPSYDFARAIVGDKGELSMLLKPGAESHSFDPSPADMIDIEKADIFIYIGGENEDWVEDILESVDTGNLEVICMMDFVDVKAEEIVEGMEDDDDHDDEDDDDHDDGDEQELDEHIWTSPSNAKILVDEISKVLAAADQDNKAVYEENAKGYIDEIEAVRVEMEEVAADAKHGLMIFGDRFPFRYFADEFGLEYRAAFPGCSTETEASAGTVAYLIDKVKEEDISYIFYIELSNENIANTICEETGAEKLLLNSCQNVTKDDYDAGETYVSLMKKNVENLRKGLN